MTLPDVYIELELNGKRYRTLVKTNTLTPKWKRSWMVESKPNARLYIKVMDKDFSSHDIIGEANVLLKKVPTTMMFGQVLALRIKVERLDPPPRNRPTTRPTASRPAKR